MIHLVTQDNVSIVRDWFEERGKLFIFPNVGILWEEGGVFTGACFALIDQTGKVGFITEMVSNPGNTPYQSARAIMALLKAMEYILQQQGVEIVYTLGPASVGRLAERQGHTIVGEGHALLLKVITPDAT